MSLELQSLLPYPNSCPGTSPHQQERDTKMGMLSFRGIDVSRDRLDVMILPDEKCCSVSNDSAGWAELVEKLRGFSIAAIGIEASGGYERGVMRALLAADISVRQVNPFKLRQFARASGVLAKSDPLDARMIASFVAIMPTRPAQRPAPAGDRVGHVGEHDRNGLAGSKQRPSAGAPGGDQHVRSERHQLARALAQLFGIAGTAIGDFCGFSVNPAEFLQGL